MVFEQWEKNVYMILIFLSPTNLILEDGYNIYFKVYILNVIISFQLLILLILIGVLRVTSIYSNPVHLSLKTASCSHSELCAIEL